MKTVSVIFLLTAGLVPLFLSAEEQDPLAEHISFYNSFDGSIEPDQARGSDKIIVGNLDRTKFTYIQGVKGKALLAGDKAPALRFKVKGNIDFAAPGSVSFWFNPVDWVVQTPETPNQGNTRWKETRSAGFFATSYSPAGYIVLQRSTSHVPGGKDVLMLVFPCFKDITKSNVRTNLDFPKNRWRHMAMTWDGLNYFVYLDGKEVLRTSVPYKITEDKVNECFVISTARGLAFDEFAIYDKQLSAEEIAGIIKKDDPAKK